MLGYQQMKEIKTRHLNKFLKTHSEVAIGTVKIKISRSKKVREYQPKHLARAFLNELGLS